MDGDAAHGRSPDRHDGPPRKHTSWCARALAGRGRGTGGARKGWVASKENEGQGQVRVPAQPAPDSKHGCLLWCASSFES